MPIRNSFELPPAPQLHVYGNAPEQTSELDEHHDDGAYDVDELPYADDEHQHEAPRVRRPKLVVAMAMFSLVVTGTAGAFGYRAMISSARLPMLPPIINAGNQPIKIAPAANETHAKYGGRATQVDTETTGSIEKLVSREEQPVRIEPPKPAPDVMFPVTTPQGSLPRAGATSPGASQLPRGVAAAAAPALAGTARRRSQSGGGASSGAHLATAPATLANANSTAGVSPAVSGGGYAVQVTSERSQSGAHAAFRALQAKYPNQLSGGQPIIRRADLGAAGTYYRALVGPFASAEEATRLCSRLKAAGGNCIIQKN
jgi:hypothetical protein